MEIKSINPKLKQSETPKELKKSASAIQRCRREKNMLSLYSISPPPNTNYTRKQKTLNTNLDDVKMTSNDLKMTSNDLKRTSNQSVKPEKKNKLKGGANIEIKNEYLD